MMEELIARTINSVDKTLKSCPWWLPDDTKTRLNDIRRLFIQLSKLDLLKNDRTRLFCQQLKRLMDYNDSLPYEFWTEIYSDVLYLFEVGNDEQRMSNSWNRFITRMNFEKTLEERQFQDEKSRKERKSLTDLFQAHKEFFEEYLQRCISLHSTVQVQSLIEDTDDFLHRVFAISEEALDSDIRMSLKARLKCVPIPLDFSGRFLCSLDRQLFEVNDAYTEKSKDLTNFLPSQQPKIKGIGRFKTIESIMGLHRWIVILGDPGSAKTTLLRWITQSFARAASNAREKLDVEGGSSPPIRIPILIRISEFAEWFSQNGTKTFIDYIGQQTWFCKCYCNAKDSSVLKELIYHGHALILLDGLDEVLGGEQRKTIVDLVERFVDEYVRASDYISAFDKVMFDSCSPSEVREVLETRPSSEPGGNQFMVTSRIVGYQFRPLDGSFIRHYSLLLMNEQQANRFLQTWIAEVSASIHNILLAHGIPVSEQVWTTWLQQMHHDEQTMFEKNPDLLQSNPLLLSLICSSLLQPTLNFGPKCRVEIYDHAVQTALRTETRQESKNFKNVLTNFLVDLATYLHLRSSSGLIDAFDLEHLCVQTLKTSKVASNRAILQQYTREIISLLESNTILVVEKGLQIFGFLHLSFQEYFVAQGLIDESSVQKTAACILSLTMNSRFRESLRLAVGWISWKWPADKYEHFCTLLFAPTANRSIPFGVLLFFDTITDLHCLPSNSIVFLALNRLLNHPIADIREKFLMPNLSKLPAGVITEWMQFHLKEEKHLLDFCLSFLRESDDDRQMIEKLDRTPISASIYQQLWLLHRRSLSMEFVIDQILRRRMAIDDLSAQVFNKDFSLHLPSNIHPLILSVVVATCGGMRVQEQDGTTKIDFSPLRMHRESASVTPILKYFEDNDTSPAAQIQALITHYECTLERSPSDDTSVETIDALLAFICLKGLSQPAVYRKYIDYRAFPLAFTKLQRTWFYSIKSSVFPRDITMSSIRSDIASVIKMHSLLEDPPEKQHRSFPSICDSVWKRFTQWSVKHHSLGPFLDPYGSINLPFHLPQKPVEAAAEAKPDSITQYMNVLQMLEQKPLFLVSFLPQSIQQLYYYTTMSPVNENDLLPFPVFLSQCLTCFDNVNKNRANDCFALSVLQPLFKDYMFESYSTILLREKYAHTKDYDEESRTILEAMKDRSLPEQFLSNQLNSRERLIDVERQRIDQAKNCAQDRQRDLQLFTASVCLARLTQAQDRRASHEVRLALADILDPVLRIIAWSIVLDMNDPLIFDEDQRCEFRQEMVGLFRSLLPDLSLLKATLLFVRCYSSLRVLPTVVSQSIIPIIISKFNETAADNGDREQEAAYLALQQFNHPDLSHQLLPFLNEKKNWSKLFELNSNTFHQYFIATTSFHSANTILLAFLYLTELAFDAAILNLYSRSAHSIQSSQLTELRALWNDASPKRKILTFSVASWITNYLRISSNTEEIAEIFQDVRSCSVIQAKALRALEAWLDFRTKKHLQRFAYYAALQLVTEGVAIDGLIDIIEDLFLIDTLFCLQSVVERLLTSASSDILIVRQILILFQRHDRLSARISLSLDRQELLDLFLSLEQERIVSRVYSSSTLSSRPFLLMIQTCSEDLQFYLVEHLRLCVDMCEKVQDAAKEEYLATVVKWIIERFLHCRKNRGHPSTDLYVYIFGLLHGQTLPQIQKVVIFALGTAFSNASAADQTSSIEIQMQSSCNITRFAQHTGRIQIMRSELPDDICLSESDCSPIILSAHQLTERNTMQSDILANLEELICSWEAHSESIIAACLLVYGNCLLMLQRCHMTGDVSDQVIDVLVNLSQASPFDVISTRATFCLIFSQHSSITCRPIPIRYRNTSNMTPNIQYKLLLYQESIDTLINSHEIIRHLEMYYDELIGTFLTDLYDYLGEDKMTSYLAIPAPDYIHIAVRLMRANQKRFFGAVQKSSFGEKAFQNRLHLCCKSHRKNLGLLIELCLFSGVVSSEFVTMIRYIDDDKFPEMVHDLDYIRQVSDRAAIKQIFEIIDLTSSSPKLRFLLNFIRNFAESDSISLSEVHEKITLLKNVSSNERFELVKSKSILDLLLKVSCFKARSTSMTKEHLYTEGHIEDEFKKEIQKHHQNSTMFLRGILYLRTSESTSFK